MDTWLASQLGVGVNITVACAQVLIKLGGKDWERQEDDIVVPEDEPSLRSAIIRCSSGRAGRPGRVLVEGMRVHDVESAEGDPLKVYCCTVAGSPGSVSYGRWLMPVPRPGTASHSLGGTLSRLSMIYLGRCGAVVGIGAGEWLLESCGVWCGMGCDALSAWGEGERS